MTDGGMAEPMTIQRSKALRTQSKETNNIINRYLIRDS